MPRGSHLRTSALILALCLFSEARAEVGLGLSPMKLQLRVPAGGIRTEALQIYNRGEEAALIRVYVQDWTVERKQPMVFLPPGTLERSASSWVELSETQFSLYPGESRIVRASIRVPEGVGGTYWCVIFFEGIRQKRTSGMGVGVGARLGTTVYVTAEGTEVRAGTLTALSATPKETGEGMTLATTFANLGNIYFYPKGSFRVEDQEGKAVFTSELTRAVCLPAMSREYLADCDTDLPPGTYRLIVTIDYGAEELLQGEAEFVVPAHLTSTEAEATRLELQR